MSMGALSTDSGDWPFPSSSPTATVSTSTSTSTSTSGSGGGGGGGGTPVTYGTARHKKRGGDGTSKGGPIPSASASASASVSEVRVELLQKGDVLKVMPGAGVPTDGHVIMGSGFVDESMITGESKPVRKGPGDFVFGSTVNSEAGMLYIRVASLGKENALSQIVDLSRRLHSTTCGPERGQQRRCPICRAKSRGTRCCCWQQRWNRAATIRSRKR